MRYSKQEIEDAKIAVPAERMRTEEEHETADSGAPVDLVSLHLDYHINLVTNTVNFTGEFNLEAVEALIQRMDFLVLYNPEVDINLRISSFGGDVYSLFALLDYINGLPVKVNGYAYGVALSAGAWLLTCLTGTRSMGANACLLVHEGDTEIGGKVSDISNTAKQLDWIGEKMVDLLVEHTTTSREFWVTHQKDEMYFTASQALEMGLVDGIGVYGDGHSKDKKTS